MYKKISLFSTGLLSASFGAALFSSAAMGMDAFSTFSLGIADQLQLSFGISCIVAGLLLLTVLFLFDRNFVKIGSVLYAFGLGSLIDFWFKLFPYFLPLTEFSYLKLFIGILFFSIGIALYICADVGSGAVEAFSIFLAQKTSQDMGIVRLLLDVFFLSLGILLGASIGVGTILGVILIGPFVSFFVKLLTKILENESFFLSKKWE